MKLNTGETQARNDDFKGNFNFSSLLEKNEKKAAQNPISSLLQSTTQTVLTDTNEVDESDYKKDQLLKKIDDLERRFETKEVNEKFERLESLLQSIIINQSNQQDFQKRLELKKSDEVEAPPINKTTVIAASLVSTALILSSVLLSMSKSSEVKSVAPAQVEKVVKKEFHTPIKYLNLRATPSTKGEKLEVVAPNTRIEIIKTDGDWVQIQYKNYLRDTLHTGWVYDIKNLKSI